MMEEYNDSEPPLVHGGQGRTGDDVEMTSRDWWTMIFAVCVIVIAAFAFGGC
jgi:hypothetical protein